MAKRLLLHIGQTKAGSTAIQNYLSSERDALLEIGVLVPQTGFSRRNPFSQDRTSGHLSLLTQICKGDIGPISYEISQNAYDTILLSAENIFFDRPDEDLVKFSDFFSDYSIDMICVLRSQENWLPSRYIEDVLSGVNSCLLTFEQFCEKKFDLGEHDYAGRLEDIAAIFRSSNVRVINYDAILADTGLVPTFLHEANLPSTNDDLASGIRANVREKELFLVEGKRRLNHVHAKLPSLMRKELERDVRDYARQMAKQIQPYRPLFSENYTSFFPARICREIEFSNLRLVNDFGLVPPLTDPKPKPVRTQPEQHRRVIDGVDELLKFGLHRMAILLQAARAQTAAVSAWIHPLALDGHEILIEQIIAARVILVVNAPDAAVIAACFHDKLPVYLSSPSMILQNLPRLSDTKLPSDVVILDAPDQLHKLLARTPADLVICPLQTSLQQISDAWACAAPDAVLVIYGRNQEKLTDMALGLNLLIREQTGAFALLVKQNTTLGLAVQA